MTKNDAIGEVSQGIIALLDKSSLSQDEKKKAVWRVEGTLNKGNSPAKASAKPKKAKGKKSKK